MHAARALMEKSKKKSFPNDLDYVVSLDTTEAVTEGIDEIVKTLFEALVLVIIVVFVFLQGWRATLIPLLAVPVSLVGTFMFFPLFGFSINTLSLFGLVLAIGLVVDDAIVVVEAVEHHIEQGLSPKDATLKAMSEVTGPVIAIAVILAAVFVPTAFIPGITGQLYQQFAVTIAISVIISAFNALTLSPALCAMLLRPKVKGSGPIQKFYDWFNGVFGRVTGGYVGICRLAIRKSVVGLLDKFALARFPDVEKGDARKYVTMFTLHSGIPIHCLRDLLELAHQHIMRGRPANGLDLTEWLLEPGKEHRSQLHIRSIVLRADVTYARGATALDLVEKTGA